MKGGDTMWIPLALGAAFFAGVMSVLAKIGVKDTSPDLATALRTCVVLFFAWLMVLIVGSHATLADIDARSVVFLVLSGLATGASWLCYFRALRLGDVNKVAPVDKSSVVLTMLLASTLLGEGLTVPKIAAMALIGAGTYLMIERKAITPDKAKSRAWLAYALLAALFASLTAILGKIGITGVEANLGTAIRTAVVLVMAWLVVFIKGEQSGIRKIDKKSWAFIALSGLATGLSWLCFYRALQEGPASVVVPIDKMSILVTVGFGYFVLKERLGKKPLFGLGMIVCGTVGLLLV
jgi:transporter family protein